jgi:hypothetical protein
MQEKRKLVPVKVNWKAGAYEIYINGSEQSTLIATTIVALSDGSNKRLKIIFELFAECRYFNYNFWESNYNESLIQAPDGEFRIDTADWEPYSHLFKETGICPNPYFYEIQNTNWFNEKWYQKLTKQNYKHFLLTGYDSYLELLAKDSVKYEFEEL